MFLRDWLSPHFAFAAIVSLLLGFLAREAPAETGAIEEIRGVPWTGNPGVTETVDQIMAREAKTVQTPAGLARKQTHGRLLNRFPRAEDPFAPRVSQWPPPDTSTASGPAEGP